MYHWLLSISWLRFFALVALVYFSFNFLFALAYWLDPEGIANARPDSFLDVFSFSVQTMATIGYGAMYPDSLYVHLLVAIEVFVGILFVAMATSLLFARFSRPSARVLFSRVAVVSRYNGMPTFMFRAANQRLHTIVEAQIRASILQPETSEEGYFMRRLHDLKLLRSQTPIFSLSMLVMHPIDAESPLHGETLETLMESGAQIIVMLTGIDENISQTVHASHVYYPHDIVWNARFVDVISTDDNGDRHVDYRRFHKTEPEVATVAAAPERLASETSEETTKNT